MTSKLNEYIFKVKRPFVLKNMLKQCSALKWTPEKLTEFFKYECLTFRIGRKSLSNQTQFENECNYVEATVQQFLDWSTRSENNKKRKLTEKNLFDSYEFDSYWAYADYKYMLDFIDDNSENVGKIIFEFLNF